jgi:hypothetical protein
MTGTRAAGELLAGGAVCQGMRNSKSSGTFVAATLTLTFRRGHVVCAGHSMTSDD